jgi:hypothetical protein
MRSTKNTWTPERDQFLLRMLAEGVQQSRIAEMLGVFVSTVEKRIVRLRKQGVVVPTQRTGPRSGAGHPEWKGGRIVDKNGYLLVYAPGHPMARGKYALEHRLVMAEKLGRMLTPEEVVHHKDKNKLNNHPDNLELFAKNSDHLKHELTGHIPNWTEEGKRRIAAGVAKRADTHRGLKRGVRPTPQN